MTTEKGDVVTNSLKNLDPSPISNQMEPLDFFIGPPSLLLASQKTLYHIIWTWKSTPKVSSKIVLVFEG
jgi:hypothetical protein